MLNRMLPILLVIPLSNSMSLTAGPPTIAGQLLSDVALTRPGGPIAVRLATPFAKASDERKLRDFLKQPHTLNWDVATPLVDIAHELSQVVSVRIDTRALDEIGIVLTKSTRTNNTSPSVRIDPFSTTISKQADRPSGDASKLVSSAVPWWRSTSKTHSTGNPTNAARLFEVLNHSDLTLVQRSGQWFITTVESSEAQLDTRLYDVTPIKLAKSSTPVDIHASGFARSNWHSHQYDNIVLIDQLETHICPDTWESLGGPSTMTVIDADQTWIAVSAPTTVHWKIEAFLSQLNQAM